MDRSTSYPFPPVPYPVPFPASPPLNARLADLSGLWLLPARCCRRTVALPLALMAARHGWDMTLGQLLDRLRCQTCGNPPASVRMTDMPDRVDSTIDGPVARVMEVGRRRGL